MPHSLSFDLLLGYTDAETRRWQEWFRASPPEALDVPIGEGRTATVGGPIVHIAAVELRYAERLLGEPVTPYEALPTDSIDAIFDAVWTAREKLRRYLASATEADFARVLTFETVTMGTLSASAHRIIGHVLIHGVRHWAQIATPLRQHGYRRSWPHDFLFYSEVGDAEHSGGGARPERAVPAPSERPAPP